MVDRIALVSCVKKKQASRKPAQDLYVSDLFKSMRRYAEKNAKSWFILSAKHGLLGPDQVIAPYELTLNTMPKADRMARAAKVQDQLKKAFAPGARGAHSHSRPPGNNWRGHSSVGVVDRYVGSARVQRHVHALSLQSSSSVHRGEIT